MSAPRRGFEEHEFLTRLQKAQMAMAKADLDALLLTTHPDIFYFTGFLTRFWESPTRPWYLVVPQSGAPVAVIPSIGAPLMQKTWIEDIRTWQAPDLQDDGVTLLAQTLNAIVGPKGRVGVPDGIETHLRMPLADFNRLKSFAAMPSFSSDQEIMRALRMVKSEAEIAKIAHACAIAGRAFSRVKEIAAIGEPLDRIFRRFQMICLEEGADWVSYLAGGAGAFGYLDVISPAPSTPLQQGDILMLDTGLVWDGYFCDYDRNFALGAPMLFASDVHRRLIDATNAGFEAIKPGRRACDIFHAMDRVLTNGRGKMENGRLGHGLGITLTEWPSLIPSDQTILQAGMVLTLEPSLATKDGSMMVHEENIVVTDQGARYLSQPAHHELPILESDT